MDLICEWRALKIQPSNRCNVEDTEEIVWNADAWKGVQSFEGIVSSTGDTKEFTPAHLLTTHRRWETFPLYDNRFVGFSAS